MGAGSYSSPALGTDGTIYIGSEDHNLYAIDGKTGTKKWVYKTQGIVSSPVVGSDGTVYVGSQDHCLYAVDGRTGKKRWAYETGASINSSPTIGNDGTVYVGSQDHKLYALDIRTGRKKWAFSTGGGIEASPAVAPDGTVYVCSENGRLYALSSHMPSQSMPFLQSLIFPSNHSPLVDRLYRDGIESGRFDAAAGVNLEDSSLKDVASILLYLTSDPPPQMRPATYYPDIKQLKLAPADQQKALLDSFIDGYKLGHSRPLIERLYKYGVESGKSDAAAGVNLKASLVRDQPTALLYMMAPPPPQKKPRSYYEDIQRVTSAPKDQQKVLIDSFLRGYKLGFSKKPPKVQSTARLALQRLGTDVLLYAIDYDNRLPSIRTISEARSVLSAYLGPGDTFVNPETGKGFIPNRSLSGKLITLFAHPQDTFIFCTSDALPGQGHEAVMLDGKVRLLSKIEWATIEKHLQSK